MCVVGGVWVCGVCAVWLSVISCVVIMFVVCFFFFKQKTAYEMLRSLVGSEMCIRDRFDSVHQ